MRECREEPSVEDSVRVYTVDEDTELHPERTNVNEAAQVRSYFVKAVVVWVRVFPGDRYVADV
jgi:hypothetical protein